MWGRRAARRGFAAAAAAAGRRRPAAAGPCCELGPFDARSLELESLPSSSPSSSGGSGVVAGDDGLMRRVILTFSGKVPQSEGTLLWKRVAGVMGEAKANIETAGGSFLRLPCEPNGQDSLVQGCAGGSSLSVSAFGACIEPSRASAQVQGTKGEALLGCAMYIKALLPNSHVGLMLRLLETHSPLEVYTVSFGAHSVPTGSTFDRPQASSPAEYTIVRETGVSVLDRPEDSESAAAIEVARLEAGQEVSVLEVTTATPGEGKVWARIAEPSGWLVIVDGDEFGRPVARRNVERVTGTIYLFGVDRPGQLARITTVLRERRVTVYHLRVQSGEPDVDSCDFVPATGGPLAENRLRIVCEDPDIDLTKLRMELERVGREVGYAVTCLTTDTQSQLRAWWPSYLLRRKAFSVAFAAEMASREAEAAMHRRQRLGVRPLGRPSRASSRSSSPRAAVS